MRQCWEHWLILLQGKEVWGSTQDPLFQGRLSWASSNICLTKGAVNFAVRALSLAHSTLIESGTWDSEAWGPAVSNSKQVGQVTL